MMVFLNPGHDIQLDSGAKNDAMGLRECDIARDVGRLLTKYLEAVGIEVNSMQDDDLNAVCALANYQGADIFISLHCNAANACARGSETWYHHGSITGKLLAEYIQDQLADSIPIPDRGVKDDTTRYKSGFQVLRETDMPAVLVEMAFIDNGEDATLLRDNQDDFARAIARGVTDFMGSKT